MVQYVSVYEPDHIRQPGQNYVLLSFAGPGMKQKAKEFAIKFRGAFATVEEASRVAKQFEDSGDKFVMTAAESYQWLPMPPDFSKIQDQRYTNERLSAIMSGHDREERDAKIRFEQRKEALERDGIDQHLLPEEQIAPPTRDVYDYLQIPENLRPEDLRSKSHSA